MSKNHDTLYHYGVKGMRWGHRKVAKYQNKARIARESADEWDEMSDDARKKGKTKRAEKYSRYAKEDRIDADKYDKKALQAEDQSKIKSKKINGKAATAIGATVVVGSLATATALGVAGRLVISDLVYNNGDEIKGVLNAVKNIGR